MRNSFFIALLEYCFVFLVILEFNTVYSQFPAVRFLFRSIPLVILTLLMILRKEKLWIPPFLGFYYFGALLPLFNVHDDSLLNYIYSFILFIPLSIVYLYRLKNSEAEIKYSLLFKYSNIIFVLAVLSLIFWIFGSTLGQIKPTTWILNGWTGQVRSIPLYYGVYSETQRITLFGFETLRNSGIFNEGPMHNMILCFALAIEIFLRKPTSKLRITIFVATIVTTFTTTGQYFLIILLLWRFYTRLKSNSSVIMYLGFPVIFSLALVTFSSINEEKEQTSSYNSRMSDIQKCVRVGFENPVLGVELFHKREVNVHIRDNYGYSNSLFTIFAHGGFYTLILYITALLALPLLYMKKKGVRGFASVIVCYFLLFAITVSHYRLLTFLVLSHSLAYLLKHENHFLSVKERNTRITQSIRK